MSQQQKIMTSIVLRREAFALYCLLLINKGPHFKSICLTLIL